MGLRGLDTCRVRGFRMFRLVPRRPVLYTLLGGSQVVISGVISRVTIRRTLQNASE